MEDLFVELEDKINYCHEITDRVFGEGGILSQRTKGYEVRTSQVEGIKRCLTSLLSGNHIILEGPCGFGKSLLYLFSATLVSMVNNKRVIICTAGITLQDQLEKKDLPTVIDCLYEALDPEEIKNPKYKALRMQGSQEFISLKGRSNYVCQRKYETMHNNLISKKVRRAEDDEKLILEHIEKGYTELGQLPFVPSYSIWNSFSCKSKNQCLKAECKYHKTPKCKYTYYRNILIYTPILVVNYHLLFSSILAGGILGDSDIMVFDEAHEVPKIARAFLTTQCSIGTLTTIQNDLADLLNNTDFIIERELNTKEKSEFRELAASVNNDFEVTKASFQNELSSCLELVKNTNVLIERPVELSLVKNTTVSLEILKRTVGLMVNILSPYVAEEPEYSVNYEEDSDSSGLESVDNELKKLWENISNFHMEFINILTVANKEEIVYYAKLSDTNIIYLYSTPIKVDKFMGDNVYYPGDKPVSTITTSATLTTDNNFEFIRDELGLTHNIVEFIGESPFDLEHQQLLYMPSISLPGNDFKFLDYSIDTLVDLTKACNGGVLALFTSVYAMNKAASELKFRIPDKNIIVQGEMSREHILRVFTEDEDSILIATKSFFTGIDVRGNSLRCVFLDKLPFETPDDPIVKALQNKNGFMKYSLPNMLITLKQAFGRGVRSTTDKAVVCVADNRLSTARYKGKIKNSFNYTISSTKTLDKVKQFMGE